MAERDDISPEIPSDLSHMDTELESDLDLPRVLVITDEDTDIIIDCPGEALTDNDRIAMLVRALFVEMAEDIVAALAAIHDDDDD